MGFYSDRRLDNPVSSVVVQSSTFVRRIELFGERSSIIGVNGLYTTSPCLNQRFMNKQTVDFSSSAVKYDASGYFLVRPLLGLVVLAHSTHPCMHWHSCGDRIGASVRRIRVLRWTGRSTHPRFVQRSILRRTHKQSQQ